MKAAICTGYGTAGNLVIGEIDKPTPRKNEVLIKVLATTVTTGDWRVRSLQMPRGFNLLARLIFWDIFTTAAYFGYRAGGYY